MSYSVYNRQTFFPEDLEQMTDEAFLAAMRSVVRNVKKEVEEAIERNGHIPDGPLVIDITALRHCSGVIRT